MSIYTQSVCNFSIKHRIASVLAISLIAFAASIALPQMAQAQEQCTALETNEAWISGLKNITELIDAGNFESALATAREIYPLCPQSPILNYFVATCLKNTGDPVKATQFYQTASDNTFTIATPPQIAQKIWYARYEAEYPERSGENVKALTEKADSLDAQNRDLELKLAAAEAAQSSDSSGDAIGMWTGVGIAGAGLALAGAFGAMAFKDGNDRPVTVNVDPNDNNKTTAKFDELTAIYLGFFGAGVAMTVTGAVLTGIFGYRYTHTVQNTEISFKLSPTSASLVWNF